MANPPYFNPNRFQQNSQESGPQVGDYWQVIRNRYEVILLSLLLVLITAGFITVMMEEKYESTVVVQLTDISQMGGDLTNTLTEGQKMFASRNFIANQFERMTSQQVLQRVVRDEDLVQKWALTDENQAIAKLRDSVETENRRGTDIVEIRVRDTDADLAAQIANSLYRAYAEALDDEVNLINAQSTGDLDAQLDEQSEKVSEARIKMHNAMRELKVIDVGKGFYYSDEVVTPEDRIIQTGQERLATLEYEISGMKSQLEGLQGLEGTDLIRKAAMLGIEDQTIQRYYPMFNDLLLEEQQALESGLGANHPTVRAIRTQLDSLRGLLMEAVSDVRGALEIQITQLEKRLAEAEESEDEKVEEYIAGALDNAEYEHYREEYRTEKELLKALTMSTYTKKIEENKALRPVSVLDKAVAGDFPVTPNKPLNLILGSVLGLAFGLGIAFALEFMDTSVKTIDDVERYLNVPVLAVIPKDVGVLHREGGMSPDAEAYRILRTNIEFNRRSADANSITMVSGGAGEGKSTTLVNLAYVCAQGGYNTLIIDGDLRRPTLHGHFDTSNSVGLTNYLTTNMPLEEVILQTPIENLYFMPSGILPADAAGILNSRRMSELIQDVKSRFDLVLVDSPPILGVSDASVLCSEVDMTVVVIQHRKLPRNMLQRVKKAVESVGGTLLGVVLNNVDVRSDSQYQYYTSYYTYYASGDDQAAKPKKRGKKEVSSSVGGGDVKLGDDVY
ncbi:GumC family protein [Sulfuriroseicoccus oceanibius]|uniref:Polysaccharide biosynthesis tyrosine autokinase n=1 Tax=Sulfuriroseicoccus oceanibius TaxID=2707525 RepID=A0A6B3LBV6_9BACT|nr:polysaccharide biosynthesis tyrosine autokinase [Sulfuriroseicoccus oceanibius]QQL45796.1 polysaccharide biosynthesis tyrosine autokinase [Sulfuriroseicoccus oceanibius]